MVSFASAVRGDIAAADRLADVAVTLPTLPLSFTLCLLVSHATIYPLHWDRPHSHLLYTIRPTVQHHHRQFTLPTQGQWITCGRNILPSLRIGPSNTAMLRWPTRLGCQFALILVDCDVIGLKSLHSQAITSAFMQF
jgi:hypothetical protein